MSLQIASSNLAPATKKASSMKILTLIIKKKWFDAILSGEKTVETREVRPKSLKKYAAIKDLSTGKVYDNYPDLFKNAKPDNKGFEFVPREYDAIQFWVGYETNRPGALVAVKKAECVPYFYEDDGAPIYEEFEGQNVQLLDVDYHLGDVLNKTNC